METYKTNKWYLYFSRSQCFKYLVTEKMEIEITTKIDELIAQIFRKK